MRFDISGGFGGFVSAPLRFANMAADSGIVGGGAAGDGSDVVGPDNETSEAVTEGIGEETEEVKKDGRGRKPSDTIDYPVGKDKIPSLPLDPPWDSDTYKMLKSSDFSDEADYLQWRGELYLARGNAMVNKADTLRSLGSLAERELASDLEKTKARMEKARKQMNELREKLIAAGQDPDEVLRMLSGE